MAARTLDISALTCPMTWVRTKLELERMATGEELEVRCSLGEALESVPRSAREAGHAVTVEGTTIRIVARRKPVTSPPGEAG
jgi:TusA-related sulfurtransferase